MLWQESSREAKPEAMANEDEAPPCGHQSFSILDTNVVFWFFWQEAGGSRKRKAADAPEGANADAQSDEDEVARPHMVFVRAGFM